MSDTTAFSTLSLAAALLQNLETLGYHQMTPVQAESLPPILEGRDVIAQAQTGSGKTAAFGLGLLSRLDASQTRIQAMVLCPTRELADQVSKEIRRLARTLPNIKVLTLCGGIPLRAQLASLEQHEPHIIVGTPGRIEELLRKEHLRLEGLKLLVLDEADRMLDMGFEDSIKAIIACTPTERQTLLFSATYPEGIRTISRKVQRDPIAITVETADTAIAIEQTFFKVEPTRKLDALAQLLTDYKPESAVVFCNTKVDTQEVAAQLHALGFAVLALQGDLEQRDRDEVLLQFANRSCSVLVATDVAARGLDIKDLAAVINYDLARDADVHLHRIGRTGRAGQKGIALSLISPYDNVRAEALVEQHGTPILWGTLKLSAQKLPPPPPAAMVTLCIDGGRRDKLRPGDILGALTGDAGLSADVVGKIDIFNTRAYVAIQRQQAIQALERLRAGKVKGRNFRVRFLEY